MARTGWLSGATATRGNNDHLAEHCRDDLCPRLPCRLYKAGYAAGWEDGYLQGKAAAEPEVIYVHTQSG